jgi:hypothetical protein
MRNGKRQLTDGSLSFMAVGLRPEIYPRRVSKGIVQKSVSTFGKQNLLYALFHRLLKFYKSIILILF